MKRTNYHVVKNGRVWVIKVGSEVIDVYRTQRDLLRMLRVHCNTMWKQHGFLSEIHIHGADGQVRAKDTYGLDPVESKG